jgi:hypothetical protein
VGLGGVYGNKGAVALGIDVVDPDTGKSASLCFVTVHLQAHEGINYMHARNEDMQQVFDCMVMHGKDARRFRNHPYVCALNSNARIGSCILCGLFQSKAWMMQG